MLLRKLIILFTLATASACVSQTGPAVRLVHGTDVSAGGGPAYIISTPAAIYYLEKEGGGLSSIIDPDGRRLAGISQCKRVWPQRRVPWLSKRHTPSRRKLLPRNERWHRSFNFGGEY